MLQPGLPAREIGRYGEGDGPLLVAVAGIHGNEAAGVAAVTRVLTTLRVHRLPLRGRFVGFRGNRRALRRGLRFVEEDLNRIWDPARLEELRAGRPPRTVEEGELLELMTAIEELLAEASAPAYFLDLHSSSAPGPPFLILLDRPTHEAVHTWVPVPRVLGLETLLAGTLCGYYQRRGHRALAFEGGRHDAAATAAHHEALLWCALEHLGLLVPAAVPDRKARRRRLLQATAGQPRYVRAVYRQSLTPRDDFHMRPGFRNFQPVEAGQVLGWNRHGVLRAPRSGYLLLPRYQPQGEDAFFLGEALRRP